MQEMIPAERLERRLKNSCKYRVVNLTGDLTQVGGISDQVWM